MEEFLKQNYLIFTFGVEILAAATGLFCFKKYKNTNVKYFIYYLIYIALIELISGYTVYVQEFEFLEDVRIWLKGSPFEKNYWLTTITWKIGGIVFFAFYYSKILINPMFSKIIKNCGICFLAGSLLYCIANLELYVRANLVLIDIFGTLIILLCVIFYFIEIIQSDRILNFYKSFNFYVSSVIFIWWLIITPLIFFHIYYSIADWNFIFLKWQIYLFANMFMYLTFAFALLYCQPSYEE